MLKLKYEEPADLFSNNYEFSEFIQYWSYINKMSNKDFIVAFCEEKMYDIEDTIKLLTPTLRDIIRAEFNKEMNNENKINLDDLF